MEGMRAHQEQNDQSHVARIAVPYYGALSLPRSGLSRVYFVADVDLVTRQFGELALRVWDPKKEPNLSSWLKQEQVNGLICSDSSCQYDVALQSEGIWAMWGCTGEVSEMIEQWLREEGLPLAEGGDVRKTSRQETLGSENGKKGIGLQIDLGKSLQPT